MKHNKNKLITSNINDIKDIQTTTQLFSYFDLTFDRQLEISIQERHLENLHKLSTFEFIKHPTFNLPPLWLEPINKHIQERAKYAIRLYESKM